MSYVHTKVIYEVVPFINHTASWDLPFGIWVAGVVHFGTRKNYPCPLSKVSSFLRFNVSAALGNGEYLPHEGEEVQ
jgi:hypothetical protein